MKPLAVIGLLVGLALAIALLAANDWRAIAALVVGAGAGVLWVVAAHVPQTLASAWAWRRLIRPESPPLGRLFLLRWVREAVNALLPVAQIGGDLVRARLLAQGGVPLANAAASCTVDLAVEMMSQIVFALTGLAILLSLPASAPIRGGVFVVMALAGLVAVSFMASQRFGLFRLAEPWLVRLRARLGGGGGDLVGLQNAVARLYADPRALVASGALHLVSWALGAVETWAALKVLHLPATWAGAVAIESLGQAVRGLGFLIPGALGVQEGGYVLICALFGVAAPGALALSLVRRIRELVLGLPGLALWRGLERARPQLSATPAAATGSAATATAPPGA